MKHILKSRWHEITEEEKNINDLFEKSDKLLFEFLDIFDKSIDKNDKFVFNEANNERMNEIVIISFKKTILNVWKIWNEWIQKNKVLDYFYEIWEEILFLIKYNIFEKFELLLEQEWNFSFKDKEYWEILNIISNISSGFDKFAQIYFASQGPSVMMLGDTNKAQKKFFNLQNHLYFYNIDETLKQVLGYSVSYQPFLIFNKKITDSIYYKKYNRPLRNNYIHGYLSFNYKIKYEDLFFTFVDLYLLLRSLWYVSIVNFDTFEALKNIFSIKEPEWNDYQLEYEKLLQNVKSVENLKKADQLFSFMLSINANSHIDPSNLI